MNKPWRPADYPAPLPYIIKKEEKPKFTLLEQAKELGGPIEWALTVACFGTLAGLMAWLLLSHPEVFTSP